MNWGSPTEEMLAALRLARLCSDRAGLSEIQVAELVMGARESLWYSQARRWAEDPPPGVAADSRDFFKAGCALIVRIVDLGYDEAERRWWPLRRIWPTDDEAAGGTLILMDTAYLLARLPNVGHRAGGSVGFPVVSAGFRVFMSIVLGPRWEQRYDALMRAARQSAYLSGRRRRGG